MTQARISGATAAASSSQLRIGCASKAFNEPRAPSMLALRLSGAVLYQGRNRPMASRIPPATARSSPRPRRPRLMRREPIGWRAVDDGLTEGPDGRPRCRWAVSAPEYVAYHDE